MRPSPPPSYRLSISKTMPPWKSKLLFLAMGISVSAVVMWRGGNNKVLAQEQPDSSASSAARSLPQTSTPTPSQPVIWVNSQIGNDAKANGSEEAPFRTLTGALQAAQPNTVIQLAPGTYSTDTGEVFPIALKSGVTVQGNPDDLGHGIVIRGGGSYSSPTAGRQNVTLVGASQATLKGVTVTNPTVRGHGLWTEAGNLTVSDNTFINSTNIGVVATGSSTAIIRKNLFVLNRSSGMMISAYAQPDVRENIFQRTGTGLIINDNAVPQISNNRISQNRNGIVIEGNAHPILRSNTIEDSERDGIVVMAQAQPDLGTAKESGNNRFFNNLQHDINASATTQTLPAFGNQLASNRLSGKVDLTGNVPLTSLATIASTADRLPATHVPRSTSRTATARPEQTPPSATPQRTQLISSLPPVSSAVSSAQNQSNNTRSTRPSVSTARSTVANFTSRTTTARQTQPTNQPAISIPVPTPAAPQTNSRNGSTAVQLAAHTQRQPSAAIEISVPPPERSSPSSSLGAALQPIASRGQATSGTLQPITQATPRAVNISVPPPARPSPSPAQMLSTQTQPAQMSMAAVPEFASVAVTAAASLPRQAFVATGAAPTLGGSPITIPVPPPEQRPVTSPPVQPVAQTNLVSANSSDTQILPVPTGEIPLGNTGDMPRVSVLGSLAGGSMLLASNRDNLQYRVVVEANDEQSQSLVKSLVPDAFATSVNGQSMMQIGAFSTQNNAQEAADMLSRNGLRCIIQSME